MKNTAMLKNPTIAWLPFVLSWPDWRPRSAALLIRYGSDRRYLFLVSGIIFLLDGHYHRPNE